MEISSGETTTTKVKWGKEVGSHLPISTQKRKQKKNNSYVFIARAYWLIYSRVYIAGVRARELIRNTFLKKWRKRVKNARFNRNQRIRRWDNRRLQFTHNVNFRWKNATMSPNNNRSGRCKSLLFFHFFPRFLFELHFQCVWLRIVHTVIARKYLLFIYINNYAVVGAVFVAFGELVAHLVCSVRYHAPAICNEGNERVAERVRVKLCKWENLQYTPPLYVPIISVLLNSSFRLHPCLWSSSYWFSCVHCVVDGAATNLGPEKKRMIEWYVPDGRINLIVLRLMQMQTIIRETPSRNRRKIENVCFFSPHRFLLQSHRYKIEMRGYKMRYTILCCWRWRCSQQPPSVHPLN